jgi:hypothetical protein
MTKTLFFKYSLLDQLQICCESNTWSATLLISFESQLPMTFMVIARVENGVPPGEILKSKELYHVVQMKALGQHFQDQLEF